MPKLGVVIERSRQRNVLWNGHPVKVVGAVFPIMVSFTDLFQIKGLDCSVSEKSDITEVGLDHQTYYN